MFPLVNWKQEKHSATHAKQEDTRETDSQAITSNIPFASLCQNNFLLLPFVSVGVCVCARVSAVCTGGNLSTLRTAFAICLELTAPAFCNKHILNPAFINVDYSALCVLLGSCEYASEHVRVIDVDFFLKHPLSSFSEEGSLTESEAHRFSWLASEPKGSFCLCWDWRITLSFLGFCVRPEDTNSDPRLPW